MEESGDYVDRTLTGVQELWTGLQSLAGCHSYREVCMLAGGRIVQAQLKARSADSVDNVRAMINSFEPAPLGPLPAYRLVTRSPRNRDWAELKSAIDRLPSYAGAAPSAAMMDRCLPALRARLQMEIESRRSSNSSQPTSRKAKSVRTSSDANLPVTATRRVKPS
jgi:hypothetical protein